MKIYIDNGFNPVNNEAADILFETGFRLASILSANGFETKLSHVESGEKRGSFTSNQPPARINEANDWGADYYIGLHINSSPDKFTTGCSVAVNRLTKETESLAEKVLGRIWLAVGLQNRGAAARSDCYALRKAKMPAAVVDIGYITNKNDYAVITEQSERIAQGIAEGVMAYFRSPKMASASSTASADAETPEKAAFYQLYPASVKDYCRLNVNIYGGKEKHSPVAGADVTVYHGSDGKHALVYRGQTNTAGYTIPIELPYDTACGEPRMYCICVRHPGYLPKNQWISLKNERALRQSIELSERIINSSCR